MKAERVTQMDPREMKIYIQEPMKRYCDYSLWEASTVGYLVFWGLLQWVIFYVFGWDLLCGFFKGFTWAVFVRSSENSILVAVILLSLRKSLFLNRKLEYK